MRISRLHIITQDLENKSHLQQVKEACEGGADWIQIRLKTQSKEEVKKIAQEAKMICLLHDCQLILNDHVEIAAELKLDGVHLGKTDMPLSEARAILGDYCIIGATANSYEDVEKIESEGIANYIGFGPYKFTTTKKNLSEVLDFEHFQNINQKTQLPVIAIGGIEYNDLETVLDTPIHGVAISSGIVKQENTVEATKKYLQHITDLKVKAHESIAIRR